MGDLYPRLDELPSQKSSKIFMPYQNKKGTEEIKVISENMLALRNSLRKLIDVFYCSYTFEKGFEHLNNFILKIYSKIDMANSNLIVNQDKLDSKINFINFEIAQTKQQIFEFNKMSKEDFPRVKIEIFTDVGSIKDDTELSLGYFERKAELDKKKVILKKYRSDLHQKRNDLCSNGYAQIGEILELKQRISDITEKGKKMQQELKSINNYQEFSNKPWILDQVKYYLREINDLQSLISTIQDKINKFMQSFSVADCYDEIYNDLAMKYKSLEVQKVVENVYYRDLENLINLKIQYAKQVNDYSPIWVIKLFQKNLFLISEEINNIYDFFDRLKAVTKTNSSGFTAVELIGNYFPDIRSLTLNNYKSEYILHRNQALIRENIEVLYKNLMKIVTVCKNILISETFELKVPFSELDSIQLAINQLSPEYFFDEYKNLYSKIKFLEKNLMIINTSFTKLHINVTKGLHPQNNQKEFIRNEMRYKLKQPEIKIINASLVTPQFSRIPLPNLIQLPDHSRFKALRNIQKVNLINISKVEESLNQEGMILSEIKDLENRLEHFYSDYFEEIENFDTNYLYNFWLYPATTEAMLIQPNYLHSAFGAIFNSISFTENPKKHIWLRNQISITQFFAAFIKGLLAAGEKDLNNTESLFINRAISIKNFINSLISEELIGCLLGPGGNLQDISSGKVDEKYDQSIFNICENLAFLLLVENSKFIKDVSWKERKLNLETIFLQTIERFDKSLLNKVG